MLFWQDPLLCVCIFGYWEGPQRVCACQAWGWVLEMYAFTIACHLEGVPPAALHIKMMGQPPWDTKLWWGSLLLMSGAAVPLWEPAIARQRCPAVCRPYYLLHYTYGMDYTLEVRTLSKCLVIGIEPCFLARADDACCAHRESSRLGSMGTGALTSVRMPSFLRPGA